MLVVDSHIFSLFYLFIYFIFYFFFVLKTDDSCEADVILMKIKLLLIFGYGSF